MRPLLVFVVASLTGTGCSGPAHKPAESAKPTETAKTPDDEPCRTEVGEAAEELKGKLAEFHFPETVVASYPDRIPRCRLMVLMNRTDMSLRGDKLTAKLRDVVAAGGKIAFMPEPAARLNDEKRAESYEQNSDKVVAEPIVAAYGLRCTLQNVRTADGDHRTNVLTVTLELLDENTRGVVLGVEKVFRYSN